MRGKLLSRGKGQRADYILYYKPNMPLAGGRKGCWRFHEVAIPDWSAAGPGSLLAFNDTPYKNREQEPVLATTRSIDKEPETFDGWTEPDGLVWRGIEVEVIGEAALDEYAALPHN